MSGKGGWRITMGTWIALTFWSAIFAILALFHH